METHLSALVGPILPAATLISGLLSWFSLLFFAGAFQPLPPTLLPRLESLYSLSLSFSTLSLSLSLSVSFSLFLSLYISRTLFLVPFRNSVPLSNHREKDGDAKREVRQTRLAYSSMRVQHACKRGRTKKEECPIMVVIEPRAPLSRVSLRCKRKLARVTFIRRD